MAGAPQDCNPHLDLVTFSHGLPNFTDALFRKRRIKIVAIGSSSTAGEPPRRRTQIETTSRAERRARADRLGYND